jgi:hypothetical protein
LLFTSFQITKKDWAWVFGEAETHSAVFSLVRYPVSEFGMKAFLIRTFGLIVHEYVFNFLSGYFVFIFLIISFIFMFFENPYQLVIPEYVFNLLLGYYFFFKYCNCEVFLHVFQLAIFFEKVVGLIVHESVVSVIVWIIFVQYCNCEVFLHVFFFFFEKTCTHFWFGALCLFSL